MSGKRFQGERLKSARQLRGLTLTALAEQTGISKQSISQYESGETRPEHERGFRLASALNVPYDFFLSEDTYKTETPTTSFPKLSLGSKKALAKTLASNSLVLNSSRLSKSRLSLQGCISR